MFSNLPPITRIVLVVNVAVFLLQQMTGSLLVAYFALWPLGQPQVLDVGRSLPMFVGFAPWQLLTYAFLHGGVMHLAFNMLALVMFGAPIERAFGARAYGFYYFACVLGAAVAQLAVIHFFSDGFYPTLGASGGVFGLLLAFGMLYPQAKILLLFPPIPMPAWLFVIGYAVIELYLGVTGTAAGVAHFAHLGGMAVGLVLIQYWRGRLPVRPKRIFLR